MDSSQNIYWRPVSALRFASYLNTRPSANPNLLLIMKRNLGRELYNNEQVKPIFKLSKQVFTWEILDPEGFFTLWDHSFESEMSMISEDMYRHV